MGVTFVMVAKIHKVFKSGNFCVKMLVSFYEKMKDTEKINQYLDETRIMTRKMPLNWERKCCKADELFNWQLSIVRTLVLRHGARGSKKNKRRHRFLWNATRIRNSLKSCVRCASGLLTSTSDQHTLYCQTVRCIILPQKKPRLLPHSGIFLASESISGIRSVSSLSRLSRNMLLQRRNCRFRRWLLRLTQQKGLQQGCLKQHGKRTSY